MARISPKGEESRQDRHGLWQGLNGDQVIWEVRYVRGVPSGPYREWNAAGDLIATWPYDWDGQLSGWIRWYADGAPSGKVQVSELSVLPEFDPIGRAGDLEQWWKDLSVSSDSE